MISVMVDNWFLQSVLFDRYNLSESISGDYGKFLSSIILWDEVYYPRNEMSNAWWQAPSSDLEYVLRPYDDNKDELAEEARKIYVSNFYGKESQVVAERAIKYLLLSNMLGVDYFPSNERSIFLQKYSVENILSKLNRIDLMKPLDNAIGEYFSELNDKFGSTVFKIKRPVLVDFIMQNTPSNMSHIEYALHLKEEGPVIQYRKYLSDIEEALQKNEWKVLNDLIQYSEHIIAKTLNMDKKAMMSIDFTIAPIPSINLSKDIEIKRDNVRIYFLETLGKFAFNGREIT